jgi:hypothetical protein
LHLFLSFGNSAFGFSKMINVSPFGSIATSSGLSAMAIEASVLVESKIPVWRSTKFKSAGEQENDWAIVREGVFARQAH